MDKPSYRVMLARFPGQNQEHPDSSGYYMSLLPRLHKDERISEVVPFKVADTPATMVRNLAVKTAMHHKIDYLLMIDNDMDPDCEPGAPRFWDVAWEFMMFRRGREIEHYRGSEQDWTPFRHRDVIPATIAAPYCGPPPLELSYVFEWRTLESDSPNEHERWKLDMIGREDAARRTGVQEVAALPTGLILYDMRLFQYLAKPWFDYEWADAERSQKATTEDVYQTRNASIQGFPQYVAWDCWAAHWKPKRVRKPRPIRADSVSHVIREAVLKGVEDRERIEFVHPDHNPVVMRMVAGDNVTSQVGEPIP